MKRAILVDGNYMMQRCFQALANSSDYPEKDFLFLKKHTESDMQFKARFGKQKDHYVETLCRHIPNVLARYAYCDKIVIARDKNSWRKRKPIKMPQDYRSDKVLTPEDVQYKGNREKDVNVDWGTVYGEFDNFVNILSENFGLPILQVEGAEGDDWMYFATRYMKKNLGYDTLMYANDGDLNQTITDYVAIARQVKTKVAPLGEMVTTNKLYEAVQAVNNATIFEVDPVQQRHINEMFKEVKMGSVQHIVGNPATPLLLKVMDGDKKDNIPPVVHYTKNEKQWKRPNESVYKKWLEGKKITLEGLPVDGMRPLTIEDLYNEEFIKSFFTEAYEPMMAKSIGQKLDLDYTMQMYWQNLHLLHLSNKQIPEDVMKGMTEAFDEQVEKFNTLDTSKLTKASDVIIAVTGGVKSNSFFDQFELPKAEMKPEAAQVDDDVFAMLGL